MSFHVTAAQIAPHLAAAGFIALLVAAQLLRDVTFVHGFKSLRWRAVTVRPQDQALADKVFG